tara:strand:- start:4739 stop:5320 length:582 start_codon:yes stop_codon:yes gene_type:complete
MKLKLKLEAILKRNKKKRKRSTKRPIFKREEEALQAIINKEIRKVIEKVEKKVKSKTIDIIASLDKLKIKKKKQGISYEVSHPYDFTPLYSVNYDDLFSYLGKTKTQQTLIGSYNKVGHDTESYAEQELDYEKLEKVMTNEIYGNMFGTNTRDGLIGSSLSPDVNVRDREKFNLLRKFNNMFAMTTIMYSVLK